MSDSPYHDRPDLSDCYDDDPGSPEPVNTAGLARRCYGTGYRACNCMGDDCCCGFHGSAECYGCADCEGGEEDALHDDEPEENFSEEREWGCCYPERCLCPHPDHQKWECFTAEDAEAYANAGDSEEPPC